MLWLLLVPVLAGANSISRATGSGTTSLWHFTSLQQSWRLSWWRWVGAYVGIWVNLWVAGGQCSHLVTLFSPTHPRAFSHHVLGVFLFLVAWGTSGSWWTLVVSPVLGSGIQHVLHRTSSGWSWWVLTPGGVWGTAKAAQWDDEWHRAAWEATFLPW